MDITSAKTIFKEKKTNTKEDKKAAKIARRHNNINIMAYKEKIEWLKTKQVRLQNKTKKY
jgi:hypothetical protein